jgi:hypothetical protein
MKNIFSVFGSQNNNVQDNVAFDLDEQDLEQVNGAGGNGSCYDDDDSCDYDDDDYCHRHHHHRHHHHHHC